MCFGIVQMKRMNHRVNLARFCYYSRSGLESGLLSRSGVEAAVMTHRVGEESWVVTEKNLPYPKKLFK